MTIFRGLGFFVLGGLVLTLGVAARADESLQDRLNEAAKALQKKSAPSVSLQAPPHLWWTIMENVSKNGDYFSEAYGDPAQYRFTDIRGSTESAHTADYFNVSGALNLQADGVTYLFFPMFADIVSENWTIEKKGDWSVEQWLFRVSDAGRVMIGMHNFLHEKRDADHEVLGDDQLGIEKGGKEAFESLVERWGRYKPKAQAQ
jgi:hypothetical protein